MSEQSALRTAKHPSAQPGPHELPALPYDHAALEPIIDALTLRIHHEEHHAGYVEKLNDALAPFPELQSRSVDWLLVNLAEVPRKIRTTVRQNAGGHLNHNIFWNTMAPPGRSEPSGALADAIVKTFDSVEAFKARFVETGKEQFGSGWVWLARREGVGGELKIFGTAGHDTALLRGCHPILVNDVWEHAYYLKYQNRREEYLKGWWPLVNWEEAARRYEASVG
jgi:superoxide dismutase, Fe-Mn family